MGNDPNERERSIIRKEFEPDEATPETAVVETIADLEETDPNNLSPLYSTIDGVLADIFDDPPVPAAQVEITVSYEGYRITIYQDGTAEFVKVTDS